MKKLFESFNKFIKEEAEVIPLRKPVRPYIFDRFIMAINDTISRFFPEVTAEVQKDNLGQIFITINTNVKETSDGKLFYMTDEDYEQPDSMFEEKNK